MHAQIELLTDELKHLVGWGAKPAKLAVLPTLRSLVDVEAASNLTTAGCIIRAYLVRQIDAIDQPIVLTVRGREYISLPCKTQRAYRLEFAIDGSRWSAPERRYRAIVGLGLPVTVEDWRRPDGLERDFMRWLSERLLRPEVTVAS